MPQIDLDDNVLAEIARLICGDDLAPRYRRSYEIERFFRNAGWPVLGEIDGPRRRWVHERLLEHRGEPELIERVVLRLADPREYLGEDSVREEVTELLNDLLAVEGYQVTCARGRPQLVEADPDETRPAQNAPLELTADIAEIVHDAEFGRQLQGRLDEAYRCWTHGSPTAAIIMLGSVLEGVLYDVARSRHDGTGKAPTDHLQTLIETAQEEKWIARDVADYAHVLRDHRNLVHPKKQWTHSYSPADGTVHIAWQVVVASLNDLAALS